MTERGERSAAVWIPTVILESFHSLLAELLVHPGQHSFHTHFVSGTDPISYSSCYFCWGDPLLKGLKLCRFKSDRDKIWHGFSLSKFASIDRVGFLILRHNFKICIRICTMAYSIKRTADCQRVNSAGLQRRVAGKSRILNRRPHRRRSSVNFGGKTFLPENICTKN